MKALICLLVIGCASREERVISRVRTEALRLLEERLHVRGHVGEISESGVSGTTRQFIVTFSDVSDTVAEVSIDAQSNEVRASSLGGGL